MNLADVMKAVAAQVDTITELNVFSFPPAKVEAPAAFVDYPESVEYGQTYVRGMDRMTVPLILVAGRVDDESARDALGAYADGSGSRSVKAVVEAGTYTACDTVTVTRVDFDVWRIAGTDYVAAQFTLDITGSGSS